MPEEINPHTLFQRALRGWWLIVLLMLLGAAAAFVFHSARPPLYEGQASITFAFDVTRTGKTSAAEEDMIMGTLASIFYTSPVPELVEATARAQGIELQNYPDWWNITLERKNNLWVLRTRLPNPDHAAALANIWIEKAYAQLLEASRHSEQAEVLRRSMESLESCLQQMAVVEPASAQCSWITQAQVQQELKTLGEAHFQEKQAARGLVPALIFTINQKAVPNARAVIYDRNSLLLAGALIGGLLALVLVTSGLLQSILNRCARAKPPASPV